AGEALTAGGGAAWARLARELDNLVAAHAQAIDEARRSPEGEGAELSLSLARALATAKARLPRPRAIAWPRRWPARGRRRGCRARAPAAPTPRRRRPSRPRR